MGAAGTTIPCDTSAWEEANKRKPKKTERGDWLIQPPAAFGKRPWLFLDQTYAQTLAEARAMVEARNLIDPKLALLPWPN